MAAKGKAPRINARRSIAELEAELLKRTAERDEALEQQTATAQVLQVINSSPGDLTPVFDAILEKAVRLCGAVYGNLLTYDGQLFSVAAAVHPESQLAERALSLDPFPPAPGGPLDRIVHGEEVSAAENIEESAGYRTRAKYREVADRSGFRSLLNVALRKEGGSLPRRARRWSSRPRPLRYCRSSILHPAILCRFSRQCWKKQSVCAAAPKVRYGPSTGRRQRPWRHTGTPPNSSRCSANANWPDWARRRGCGSPCASDSYTFPTL